MVTIVVDSGRLRWHIGYAGDDSATCFSPGDSELLAYHDEAALQDRWQENVSLLADFVRQDIRRREQHQEVQSVEHEPFDGCVLFTCSACDDSESKHVRDIMAMAFAPDSDLGISHVDIVPQEILMLYSSGRTTGLVVNLGVDVTIVGVYEGHLLGETVRRAPMVASEDVYIADAAKWEERTQLAGLVSEALEAAPVDVRRDLAGNIVVGGGRWGGWPGFKDHLKARLDVQWDAAHPPDQGHGSRRVKVTMPPEAGQSAWLGGSILASLGVSKSFMRNRESWCASDPSGIKPSDLADRWKPAWLALPPDRALDSDARMALARERVRAAPSLCATLPADLQDAVAERVAQLRDLDVPAIRTTAYLPPPEVVGAAALEERLGRARILAAERSVASAAAAQGASRSTRGHDSPPQPLEGQRRPSASIIFSRDGVLVEGAVDQAAVGEQGQSGGAPLAWLAKCAEEFGAKVAAGERWLVKPVPQPWRGNHGNHGYRVGDTMRYTPPLWRWLTRRPHD